MSGSAARPELVGEKPWTTWNQRGRKTIAPKNAKAAKNVDDHRCRVGPAPPQVERDDRFLGARLGQDEEQGPDDADEDEAADGRLGPVAELLVGQADEQEDHRHREDEPADQVEVARRGRGLDRRQQPLDDDQRDDPDRDVDVEDPVPADVLGQEAADERAGDEGDPEHGPEEALVLAALLRA